jgi:hypothetical protein
MPQTKISKNPESRWGGARPGAGRKRVGRIVVHLKMLPEINRLLAIRAKAEGITKAEFAERAIAKMVTS